MTAVGGGPVKRFILLVSAAMLVPVAANAKVLLDVRADETQSSRMFSGTEAVTSVMERSVVGIMEDREPRSEEHTSELQSLMRISYAVFCLKKKKKVRSKKKRK